MNEFRDYFIDFDFIQLSYLDFVKSLSIQELNSCRVYSILLVSLVLSFLSKESKSFFLFYLISLVLGIIYLVRLSWTKIVGATHHTPYNFITKSYFIS